MNEVMDRAERAPDGFLALRLPREAEKPVDLEALGERENGASTGRSGTPAPARSRRSRGRTVGLEEEEEVTENEGAGTGEGEGKEEEEEVLKDYYGAFTGLPPLSV